MPNYGYRCQTCGHEFDDIGPYDLRHDMRECPTCFRLDGEYRPELSLTRAFRSSESYYDEGLGCDVTGERERRQIMASQGVSEAGDPVGGARDVEKTAVGKQAPKGVRYSDTQYKNERCEQVRQDTVVALNNNDGTEKVTRHGDNKSDTKKSIGIRHHLPE